MGQRGAEALSRLARQCAQVRSNLPRSIECYSPGITEPLHILIRPAQGSAADLDNHLRGSGICAETLIGSGLLLLLGFGTTDQHITLLLEALHAYQPGAGSRSSLTKEAIPPLPEQVLTPRSAFFAPTETLPLHDAIGRIAAETVAPCPPGTAAVIAGQRVPPQILEFASLQKLKVVVE
jgi:arginine/lysine/ornithine decarboxylase